jgi:hypothetical protein
MHSAFHDPNTPPPATPLVNGPMVRLLDHHGKVRRDGCQERSRAARLEPPALPTA